MRHAVHTVELVYSWNFQNCKRYLPPWSSQDLRGTINTRWISKATWNDVSFCGKMWFWGLNTCRNDQSNVIDLFAKQSINTPESQLIRQKVNSGELVDSMVTKGLQWKFFPATAEKSQYFFSSFHLWNSNTIPFRNLQFSAKNLKKNIESTYSPESEMAN